jgi:hypothetical protein
VNLTITREVVTKEEASIILGIEAREFLLWMSDDADRISGRENPPSLRCPIFQAAR